MTATAAVTVRACVRVRVRACVRAPRGSSVPKFGAYFNLPDSALYVLFGVVCQKFGVVCHMRVDLALYVLDSALWIWRWML